MRILEQMEKLGYEQLCLFTDPNVSLRAFICIHDTTLGPALGGLRIWKYGTEEEALTDVMRLARAMTYKSAAAGLSLGGGKAVIIADPYQGKSEAMMRAIGRCVESLNGRYITTEDVGANAKDLEYIAQETSHLVGLPLSQGGSGDTAPMTGFGVVTGMKACAKEVWGDDSLAGRTIAIQGFGKVASETAKLLIKEDAKLIVADINSQAIEESRKLPEVQIVSPDEIYDTQCDIFCPCALGGTLNGTTIPKLKCSIVAGGANNQLLAPADAHTLQDRHILYAPDYIINAGGVINASLEIGQTYDSKVSEEKTSQIYYTMEHVIWRSKREDITTATAADRLAEERIKSAAKGRNIYLGSSSG
jgi:leucine dehydrogenase